MDIGPSPHLVPAAGLLIGTIFGFVVQRSDWCTMGAVSDILLMDDWRRMRSWLLAVALALLGTQALVFAGTIELVGSPYLAPDLRIVPALAGGLVFGYGMTRTGGCIAKNLVRFGGGSLRALVVLLVLAGAAALTAAGPLAWLGAALDDLGTVAPGSRFPRQDLPSLLGVGAGPAMIIALLIAAGLLAFCLKDRRFRASRPLLLAGLVLGTLIPLGWLATTPHGPGTSLNYVTAALGVVRPHGAAGFGVGLIAGTALGGSIGAWSAGRFRIEGFAGAADLRQNLGGAVLMGLGGVLAGGGTVGQGLSGISTLGLTSILALGAIVAGAALGIRTLEAGSVMGALRALRAGG